LAINTDVQSSGELDVLFSGVASATSLDSGGMEFVSSGGTDIGATVSGGALFNVLTGGTASGTIVLSGGTEFVSAGGVGISATLSGHDLAISSLAMENVSSCLSAVLT
jgi:autotransporter passenger strand-loop-strand repeat protein